MQAEYVVYPKQLKKGDKYYSEENKDKWVPVFVHRERKGFSFTKEPLIFDEFKDCLNNCIENNWIFKHDEQFVIDVVELNAPNLVLKDKYQVIIKDDNNKIKKIYRHE